MKAFPLWKRNILLPGKSHSPQGKSQTLGKGAMTLEPAPLPPRGERR